VTWDPLEEPDEAWEPVRTRHRGTIRILALLIVAAMVIALIVPVLLRLLSDPAPDPERSGGVQTLGLTGSVAPMLSQQPLNRARFEVRIVGAEQRVTVIGVEVHDLAVRVKGSNRIRQDVVAVPHVEPHGV
jgi:hypothetical protein